MQKRNVRFVQDRRYRPAYRMGNLADLDELAETLTWESIDDFFFHINENTWALSRTFDIHPAYIVAWRKTLCEERCVPRYEVQEHIERRLLDERRAKQTENVHQQGESI